MGGDQVGAARGARPLRADARGVHPDAVEMEQVEACLEQLAQLPRSEADLRRAENLGNDQRGGRQHRRRRLAFFIVQREDQRFAA